MDAGVSGGSTERKREAPACRSVIEIQSQFIHKQNDKGQTGQGRTGLGGIGIGIGIAFGIVAVCQCGTKTVTTTGR